MAIIGASYLQLPLIKKAKEMGYETHVFAWAANDVGEKEADYFYPISIVEKEKILEKCKDLKIDAITSISSDLGIITVNYVAQNMGLISNSLTCTDNSTNKHIMRSCFKENGDPSPKSFLVESINDIKDKIEFPIIVKPLDRSGSRGITKLNNFKGLQQAIEKAKKEGFEKKALVEEFAEGEEYSVECISFDGKHSFLQLTYKFTSGAPSFIETAHLEPAPVSERVLNSIKQVVFHALDSLGVMYGASHSEVKVDKDGNIKIIEIGGRMGGDMIGSSLVKLSTGIDFVEEVINVASGKEPIIKSNDNRYAAIRYIFSQNDLDDLNNIKENEPDILVDYEIFDDVNNEVTDSSNRHGYYIISSADKNKVYGHLPSAPKQVE